MPQRVGHARPVGTTWRMRLQWNTDDEPRLDDLVYEQPTELHRGFRCVGVEEPAREGGRWIVWLERMNWDAFLDEVAAEDARYWGFVRDRR